ncbi:DUF3151 family protein [Agromyces archimandritae]|uniref:DUF3151 family protein n=1 Tax=Agromyces archimandritae TaxID=2781962 RepID=UPI001FD4BE90|nr:DUF3151 family protein [Agromyces archimandritae]
MTADESSPETEASLPDEPEVRQALAEVDRASIPGVVAHHPDSPLAWTELADLADSEGRTLEAYAFASVAAERSREQLAEAGWRPGDGVPWSEEANRAYLRALDTQRRAAGALGLTGRAERLEAELAAADGVAQARIASEFTPTQVLTVVRPAEAVVVPASTPEASTPADAPAPEAEGPETPEPDRDPAGDAEPAAADAARED